MSLDPRSLSSRLRIYSLHSLDVSISPRLAILYGPILFFSNIIDLAFPWIVFKNEGEVLSVIRLLFNWKLDIELFYLIPAYRDSI